MRLLISLAFTVLIAGPGNAQKIDDLIDKVEELLVRKNYDSALIVLDKAWKIDSNNYHVQMGRGLVYLLTEKWEDCYYAYTKAIEKHPDSVGGYQQRAVLFYQLVYTAEAIADNTKALELANDDKRRVVLFMNRGNAHGQKRDFGKAYEDYSRAYLLDSSNIDVLNNMATVLDDLGRRDEAIEQLKKITRVDPDYTGAYVNLGYQYTKNGNYKEAIEYFDKALSLEKNEPLTLNNRGLARYHLKDYKGALEDINKSIGIYPSNSYAYKNRALVYIAMKENAKACEDIRKALDLGFTGMYGPEVADLSKQHCPEK